MSWFKRIKGGITTSTNEKKETPEGLWYKCPSCKKVSPTNEHVENYFVFFTSSLMFFKSRMLWYGWNWCATNTCRDKQESNTLARSWP